MIFQKRNNIFEFNIVKSVIFVAFTFKTLISRKPNELKLFSRYSVHPKLLLDKTRIFLFLKLTLFLDFDSFANSADIILHHRDITKGNYFVDFHETNMYD